MRITVINGPNINMTGIREPEVYGSRTYGDLVGYIEETCLMHGAECEVFQSNHEGAIVDRIQECLGRTDAIVINAGAYSHTSIAILDALKSVSLPVAEVHMSDITKREEFRHFTYVSLAAEARFMGRGFESYGDAIVYLTEKYGEK